MYTYMKCFSLSYFSHTILYKPHTGAVSSAAEVEQQKQHIMSLMESELTICKNRTKKIQYIQLLNNFKSTLSCPVYFVTKDSYKN